MYDETTQTAIVGVVSFGAGVAMALGIDTIMTAEGMVRKATGLGNYDTEKRANMYKVLLSAPFVAVGVAPLAVEAYGESVPPEAISKASVPCLSFAAGLAAESIALPRIVKWLQKGDGQTVVSKPI